MYLALIWNGLHVLGVRSRRQMLAIVRYLAARHSATLHEYEVSELYNGTPARLPADKWLEIND